MKKTILFLPLVLLLGIVLFLVVQLKSPDNVSPSEDWRGKPFPEFRLPNLLDHNASLSKESLPREPFVLNVWASWCTWCIKEFPQLQALKVKGVKIVGLTYVDKPDAARGALEQWGNPFEFVIDDSKDDFLTNTLKISGAPRIYLVDHKGVIRYQNHGYNPDLDLEKDLQQRIDALRKEM